MRTFLRFIPLTFLSLTLWPCSAFAQDPGMMAAQQAQIAAQQANDQMTQAAQQANQAMQNAQQQASQNTIQSGCCGAATPKFSVRPGPYSAAVTLRIKDSTRGAVIYYTT